jgi:peroxiredoxin
LSVILWNACLNAAPRSPVAGLLERESQWAMTEQLIAAAPAFELASVAAGPVRLADLHAHGPAVIVFATEGCTTSLLALRRLAPVIESLARAEVRVAAIFEDPVEVAARAARRARFAGTVLAEPAPYRVSRAFSLQTLPTTVLIDRGGGLAGRVVGWDADALEAATRSV